MPDKQKMKVPKDYPMSKDIEDRRSGRGPNLFERTRDQLTFARHDYDDMKAAMADRKKRDAAADEKKKRK